MMIPPRVDISNNHQCFIDNAAGHGEEGKEEEKVREKEEGGVDEQQPPANN